MSWSLVKSLDTGNIKKGKAIYFAFTFTYTSHSHSNKIFHLGYDFKQKWDLPSFHTNEK